MKVVSIEWIDSVGITERWEVDDEITSLKPTKVISVGFLIDDKKKYKTIVQNIGRNQVLGRMTIPSCSITKMEEL